MELLKGKTLNQYDHNKVCRDVSADEIMGNKDIVCFYFSAHWCPPCRGFTPVLKKFYEVGISIMRNHTK